MRKSADAFRSIGEVSRLIGVPPHVLRYWETQFPQLAPVKRADGRRYYRPEDLHLAAGLCELLREDGMTTRGAARLIARDKGAALRQRGLARLPERFRGEAAAPGPTERRVTEDASVAEPRAEERNASPAQLEATGLPSDQPSIAAEANEVAGIAPEAAPASATVEAAADAREAAAPPPDAFAGVQAAAAPLADRFTPAEAPARPAPSAGELPLFPGLAPAALPPGIWLPRLAATAVALRGMTPPKRPLVQMQRLRDRLAALLDSEG